ncbi:hydroxymethylglutaryl-CoA lyase [Fistulifera solaris]|uniref:hydroxymethylglutaryl-CoA lyase n=1 Tax=Fistulifera solaris TaxID=1519565 RepID=A0A1Z5KJ92_FISSO|nr:hydroxymethylglutaryl-CoA lyase [Fistulifera solaris]|eukprot:GAX26326.1 hydroxymethylglutaryl-CoA lyase [Fistulifera solaris]
MKVIVHFTSTLQNRLRTGHFVKRRHFLTTPAVRIVEVGPRDGLQNELVTLSVQDRAQLIRMLTSAGCSYIEAGSFVSPKWVPQMADTEQVFQELIHLPRHTTLAALVPNLRGLEQALRCTRVDEIAIFAAASETFSQRNINCSIAESLERFRPVIETAAQHSWPVRGYVSCAIACPYEGTISSAQVAMVTRKLFEMGCYQVSLGDTIGVGTPFETKRLLQEFSGQEKKQIAVHFHDTYGQGLVNILVSLEQGITTIDSSVAGLGGCPYAKGASGNVATEDVVYMLHGMGIETGIDLTKLVGAAEFICALLGKPTRSKVGAAIAATRSI